MVMNMTKTLKYAVLAMAILFMAAAAVPAQAQTLYKATFELPFESQWGKTVIEPGQYTITVEQALGQKLIRLHGASELAIFAGLSAPEPVGDNGRLTFVNVDGVYTLKAFQATAIGKAFFFPVAKSKGARAQLTSVTIAAN